MKIIFVRHGQTQCNVDKINYTTNDLLHPLTNRGEQQAIFTGKYLNSFGKFDLIISSPLLRAKQTAELISKEIDYKNKILINDLILEQNSGEACGLNDIEKKSILMKNNKFVKIYNKIKKTTDPFEKFKLQFKKFKLESIIFKSIDPYDNIKIVSNFLNQLKKYKEKLILIVTHGGVMGCIHYLITNSLLDIYSLDDNNECCAPDKYEDGNTMIMGVLLEDKKFKLIIPSNTLHLQPNRFTS